MARIARLLAVAFVVWVLLPAASPRAEELTLDLTCDPAALEIEDHGAASVEISLPGWQPLADPAGFLLPAKVVTVAIPRGMRAVGVEVTPLASATRSLPAPPMASGGGAPGGGAPLDPAIVSIAAQGSMGGSTVVSLLFRGVEYDAARSMLRLHTRVAARVRLAPDAAGARAPGPLRQSSAAAELRASLLAVVAGGDSLAGEAPALEGRPLGDFSYFDPGQFPSLDGSLVEYLIITSDELAPSLQPLADWKTQSGVPAAIRTISWIEANYPGRDRQERIRNFIADAYQRWGTVWVLLAGDQSLIPSRLARCTCFFGGYDIAADLYYSDLDGLWDGNGNGIFGEGWLGPTSPGDSLDLYPDVFVGRAPLETTQEAQTFVSKVFTYLRNPVLGQQKTAAFAGEVVFPYGWVPGEPIELNGCELAHEAGVYVPAGWDSVYLCEWPNQNESHASVVAELQSGPALMSIVGHGDPFKWSTGDGYYFNVDDARALTNNRKYSLMFYADCTTNDFEAETVNEAMLLNPLGGSIGSVAATRPDFPTYGRFYQDEFYRLFFHAGVRELGALQALMKVPRVPLSAYDASYDRWTQLTYVLLGDPQLALWRVVPRAAALTLPASLAVGDSALQVTVREIQGGAPIAGALVTAWKPATGEYARGLTGSAGTLTLPFRPGSVGTVQVTATHASHLPALDSLEVVSGAPQLRVSATSVDDDSLDGSAGNGDGRLDAGERVDLRVTVENAGGVPAESVRAVLALPGSSGLAGSFSVDGVPAPRLLFTGAGGGRSVSSLPFLFSARADSLPAWGRPRYAASAPEDTTGGTVSGRGYLWQDASGWHLRAAGGEAAHTMSGWLAPAGGTILGSQGVNLEPGDTWSVAGDTLFYSFHVDSTEFEDGVDLAIGDDSGATLLENLADFGDLAPGQNATRSFALQTSPACAGPRPLRFLLAFTRAGGGSWQHGFRVDVAAPELALLYYAMDDAPPGGDGDGVPEAGETVSLTPFVENRGTGWAPAVGARVHFDSGASVTDSVAALGDMAAGAIRGATPALRVTMSSGLATGELILTDGYARAETVAVALGAARTPPAPTPARRLTGADWAELGWTPPTSTDLAGYNIYRAPLAGAFQRVNGELAPGAFYRDEGLTAETGYRYRYRAVNRDGNESVPSAVDTVWSGPPYAPGFPVNAGNRVWASPCVTDLDANGNREIVDATLGWHLFAWEHDGTVRRGFPAYVGQECYSSPAVANLDADPAREIVVGSSDDNLYIFKANGTGYLHPSGLFGTTGNWIQGSPTLADLDGDGRLEILVPSKDHWLYVWRADGTGYLNPDGKFGNFVSPSISTPAVADVDGDGHPEIFVTTIGSAIYAWNHDGTGLRLANGQFKYLGTGEVWGSPAIGDLDHDGVNEIICASSGGSVYVFTPTSAYKPGWPQALSPGSYVSPALGDLDLDGKLEVVVGGNDHQLHVWNYAGVPLSGFPVTLPDSVIGPPVIGDVSGDGYPDIVCGCSDHRVYAFQRNGRPVHGWPQRTYDVPWGCAPVITDLDHDGKVDVVDGSYDGYLYVWHTSVPYVAATMDWPMFQHDRMHSGWYGWVDPDGATPVPDRGMGADAAPPPETRLGAVAPNPAGSRAEVAFDLARPARVRIGIYDVRGRLVETLLAETRSAGRYHLQWEAGAPGRSALPSGLYFVRMEADGRSWSKKLVLIR